MLVFIILIYRKGFICFVGVVFNFYVVYFKVFILDVLLNSFVSFVNVCLKKEFYIVCFIIRVFILFNLKEGFKIISSGFIKSFYIGY